MIPERIGSVRLGRLLWAAGGTTTYAGVDPALDAPVAVTIPAATDDASIGRFLDAARTLRLVRSPGVLRVLDAGRLDGGAAYAITEMPSHQSVADRIAAHAGTPVLFVEAFAIATQAAECLLDAHGHGIVFEGVTTESLRYVAGDDGRERLVVAAWSVVPVAERVATTPAGERAAILDWAAGLVQAMATTPAGSAHSGGPGGPDGNGVEGSEAGREIMRRLAGHAPPPPSTADTMALPVAEPPPPPRAARLPLAAAAGILLVGLSVGAATGWVATRADPAPAPVAKPDASSTGRAAGATATPRPSVTTASPAEPTAASTATDGAVVPSAAATATPSATADDPQGRSGRYAGFITATTDGCGSLQEGRNYGITVDVDVRNRGTRADFTIRLSYRDEPVAITVTLAESGAFRGDYNIEGTAGSMSGRFAGERITDVRGKEEACEYAWSAKRGG